jgi:hypothetical protein
MQLYISNNRIMHKNNFVLKIMIAIFGYAKLGRYDNLDCYAFRCPVHGVVADYAHGADEKYLCCQQCMIS